MDKKAIKVYIIGDSNHIAVTLPGHFGKIAYVSVVLPLTIRALSYYLLSRGTGSYNLCAEYRTKHITILECLALISEAGDKEKFVEDITTRFDLEYIHLQKSLEEDFYSLDFIRALEELGDCQ